MILDAGTRWEEAYRREGPRLWRALLLVTGNREIASDVMAEAFAQGIARGDDARKPGAWVWKAAFSIAGGELERMRLQVESVPAREILAPESVIDLAQALQALTARQRIVTVLHYHGATRSRRSPRSSVPLGPPSASISTGHASLFDTIWRVTTMIDLRSRFSKTDAVETPDVWQEIEARSERIVGGAAPRLSDASELRPGSRHWLTIVVALIIGVGAVGVVVVAFSDVDNHRTARSPSAAPTPTHELTGTAKITATISLPEGTIGGGLAVGAGSLWSGLNDGHGGNGAVIRIDPETNQIVATIAVAQGPSRKRIAATDDAVWVASTGLLQRIDPATNSIVASVEIPDRSISAIAADSSDVWAVTIGADGGVLVRIDTATNAIVAEIPLGSQITGYEDEVKLGAGSVWVIGSRWIERENAEYGSDLIRVDPATNTVAARIPVGGFRMTVGPDAVWVTFPADGVFDTQGERWLWTKADLRNNEASPPFRFQADSLAVVTAAGLWSVDYDEQGYVRVTRYDPLTLSLESRSEPVRSFFHDALLDPASGTVWVATLHAIVRFDIS